MGCGGWFTFQRKGLFIQNFGKENSIMEAGSVGLISKGEPKKYKSWSLKWKVALCREL